MIVRNVESGWEIVFQSAHALLAGQLATHLRPLPKIHYWSETLTAIVDHDDHKEAFGNNVYLTELGAPKDFTQFRFTARERCAEVRRRIDSGYRKHRWIALLATRHAEELYGKEHVSKALEGLLGTERQRRSGLLHELRTNEEAFEAAYSILQWCDRTSLILCQKGLPTTHRRIETAPLNGKQCEIWENEDWTVGVDPWPFKSDSFDVHVEVRTVHQLAFATDRELERSLWACAVEDRRWLFQKPTSPKSKR